jgi:predicted phage tail protein
MRSKYHGRRLEFLFSSEAEKKQFEAEAKAHGCSACQYLRHIVQEYKNRDIPKPSSLQDIQKLKEENAKLKKDLRESDRLASVQDELIQSLQFQAAITKGPWYEGLIEALQHGPIHQKALLETLGIDISNGNVMQLISKQLGILEANGKIAMTTRGWKWLGQLPPEVSGSPW